ncbi:hypothetical protein LPJ64_000358 [Coemansia asiatica]|uniref:SPX domain-containing protein n=1 Tax=Coemansia asiatica TaxID=1052880 RepID=A0A9W7XRS6_9FUNG|nr:hypothetical protein LPJ64_000358 [Coemansia asiatica]KAJ2889056.1 hypothetical protein FB639_000175 [Coemansia asiatica]
MKFGKTIETSAKELPEDWQPYIIQYKQLKKSIKQIVRELDNTFRTLNLSPPVESGETQEASPFQSPDICNEDDGNDASQSMSASPDQEIESNALHQSLAKIENRSSNIQGTACMKINSSVNVPDKITYNIEKDSKGIVHPIITVTLNRPVPVSNISDQILELPDVYISSTANAAISESDPAAAGADKNSTSNPNIAKVILNTSDSGSPAQIARSECTGNEIKIESRRENDAQETQVIMQLQADQFFFGQLIRYIERSQEFEKTYTKQYSTNVTALGSELTAVTSPYKRDFEIWRELFRLYIDADVWEHTEGDFRPTNTAKEGQERFAKFMQHVDKIGLTKRFCDPLSLNLLVNFFKLNSELTNLKLLQEMNELAMRKILKKHDKRTQLVSKTQFPQFVTIDTTTLTKALIYTIHTELVGVVPQIDDYLCPMCLNIAWRPLRLDCAHVFCSRCVVKASRRCIFDCPVCRAKNAIYRAGVSNIDNALLNFLKLYFPREVKEKQRDIQQEISHEETRAIVAAHARERPCLIM